MKLVPRYVLCETVDYRPGVAVEVDDEMGQRWLDDELADPAGDVPVASGTSAPLAKVKLNINQASVDELDQLPGIGPATALKILEGAPYETVEEALKAAGVGAAHHAELIELLEAGEA
jgi:DNA uptake protein ComE-like DNA-binding protein